MIGFLPKVAWRYDLFNCEFMLVPSLSWTGDWPKSPRIT